MGKNRSDVMGAISNQYNMLKGQADSGVKSLNASQLQAPSIEQMNRGASVSGVQNASYGDVLDNQRLADLEALATLSGQQFDAGQKNKTFGKGQYIAPDAVPVQEAPQPVWYPDGPPAASGSNTLGKQVKNTGIAITDPLKKLAKWNGY